ncbi:BLUF domain-containing protein [Mucilaginibacter sp. 21P]|nr:MULTISPECIES: BLUF domain-containing protein [Mucilaginibacter]QXV65481.1 BLUF domain-containing protein [Mucilaginibacter sp. 21P]
MKTIVYISKSAYPMHENQLLDILHSSRIHNAAVNISGVLLYSEGTFIQLLEGRDKIIDALYKRIQADERHTNVITLVNQTTDEKSFEQWLMGFAVTDANKTEKLVGYLKSLNELDLDNKDSEAVLAIKAFIESSQLNIQD